MTLSQEIILYFEIIPVLSVLIYVAIKSYIEEKKDFKKKIWKLKKAYRKQNEEFEKQEFLWKIKNGLSTGIDKPNINNVA